MDFVNSYDIFSKIITEITAKISWQERLSIICSNVFFISYHFMMIIISIFEIL